jgi:superfamily II DNA or RNA helicase
VPSTREGTPLGRFFDSATLARGRAYASAGAVVEHEYDPTDDVVTGEVQGTARHPYEVVIQLARAESRAVVDVDGDCTCPVGYNCKHVVALVLVSGALGGASNGRGRPVAPRQPTVRRVTRPRATLVRGTSQRAEACPVRNRRAATWEKPLAEFIRKLESRGPTAEPELALQFDLVPRRAAGRGRGAVATGIRVHPVVRSSRGNWVRSGISWSQLEYRYLASATGADRRQMFRELLALHGVSDSSARHRYYSSYGAEPQVWLEDVTSRRLWDLLAQAEELGVPLVVARSAGATVHVRREPAEVGADVQATGKTVRLLPYVEVEGSRLPASSSVLIGDPPHGIAWWAPDMVGERVRELGMAPFSRPLGTGERAWIQSPPIDVPAREQTRFLREFYPRLARSMAVVSSDGSVPLPELPRPVLVLRVRHDGQQSLLRWQRGVGGSGWREDLASVPEAEIAHDLGASLAAAIELARALPALVEQTWHGERLAPALELSGMDAVCFVTELLPALAEVPDLLVEEVGPRPEYRMAAGAPVVSLRPAGDSVADDWFDLMVEVAIDDEEVVFQELFVALAEGRSHLLLPSGTYFALDRPELAELAGLIAEARAMQDREASDRIRVNRFQAGLWEDLHRLGVDTAQAHDWEVAVRGLAAAASDDPAKLPEGLDATLRPYQQAGFSWLAFLYRHELGGILADDMGLGKTLQALALVLHARECLGVENPFLVVAPTSVVENWASEARRFAPELRVVTVGETEARRWVSLSDLADKADVVVTSYTLFRLEYEDYEGIEWAGLFLDEAQFAKNPRSVACQRASALPAPFKLAITGTPIENNLKELWALVSITAPGLFPRLDRFVEHYAVPIERHGDAARLDQLRRRIRPLVIRRTKEQVESELPAKQEQVLELELAPKHRRLYDTHLQRERQKVLGLLGDVDRHRIEILRSLTILRQAALDVTLVDERRTGVPSTKLDVLVEMLQEIVADGHRVLVFSQFTRFLSAAARRTAAAGIEHCYLDGRTRKRDKVIGAFRQGETPVFFISLKAGGFGLNLTEADYCILLDPWWNPATEAQAVDRAHRIGQTRKVMVYRLVAKNTIEEKVMALKARKAALFASIMDAGGFETAALSPEDIRALIE